MRAIFLLLLLLPFISSAQYSLCDSPMIIEASSDAAVHWSCSTGQQEYGQSISIVINSTGNYSLTAVAGDIGCEVSTVIRFDVDTCTEWTFYAPDAFTPGGRNPVFSPMGELISVDKLQIYDRWGELISATKDSWDGTVNGRPVQVDVYLWKCFFTIPGNFHLTHSGRVTVIR